MFVGQYAADTGNFELGQWLIARQADGSDNTILLKNGNLYVDSHHRVHVVGESYAGLPLDLNPFPGEWTGGAFHLVYSADFSTREFMSRLTIGNTAAVAVSPSGAVATGGQSGENAFSGPNFMFSTNPLQPSINTVDDAWFAVGQVGRYYKNGFIPPLQISVDSPVENTVFLENLADQLFVQANVLFDASHIASWTQVSGPGTATFWDPTSLSTSVSFDTSGSYVIRLTVDDSITTDFVDISVEVAPTDSLEQLLAGWDLTSSLETSSVDEAISSASPLQVSGAVTGNFNANGVRIDGLLPYPDLTNYSYVTLESSSPIDLNGGRISFESRFSNGSRNGDGYTVELISDPNGTPQVLALGTTDDSDVNFDSGAISGASPANTLEIRIYWNNGQTWGDLQMKNLRVFALDNIAPVTMAGADTTLEVGQIIPLAGAASDDGIPPSAGPLVYTWSQVSGPAQSLIADPADPVSDISFPIEGTYELRLIVDDGALQTADYVTFTVTAPSLTPAEEWRLFWFGQTEAIGTAAEENDFDGGGAVNLLERAFNTDPTNPSDDYMPAPGVIEIAEDLYPTITYRQKTGGNGTTGIDYVAEGLQYAVETATDLNGNWTSGEVVLDGPPIDNGDGSETVTVRTVNPLNVSIFICVRVTLIPEV